MSLGAFAAAIGALALAPGRFSEAAPRAQSVEPLIEVRVKAAASRGPWTVDVAWPLGLKPVFPRDDGLVTKRQVARTGAGWATLGLVEDNADWANICEQEGCRLTYVLDVPKALGADRRRDQGFEEKQGIVMAPLLRWLVRPEDRRARGRLRIAFEGGKGFEMVSGAMDARVNRIETDLIMIDGPHVAVGDFTHRSMEVPGARIDIAIGKGRRAVRDDEIVDWIREGATDVIEVLGHFPIRRLQVIVAGGGPYAIGSAVTMGMGGASIFVVVGERTRPADLLRDWVMTHEMLHVAFPNMGARQNWMEEGLSTYLEPLLRARRGRRDVSQVWAEFTKAMPQGLPRDGDQGLDATMTWGRRYWGGALFWLYVDIEIRKRSGGTRSLDDMLRAIVAEGGNVALRWDVARLARVAETATGVPVFREIYEEWSHKAVTPDLASLWTSLGVKPDKTGRIVFDDLAPLASIRRDLTSSVPIPAFTTSRP
jgi:hypothetical protein